MNNLKIWDLVLLGAKQNIDGLVIGWKYVTNDANFKGEIIVAQTKLEGFVEVVENGQMTTELWKQLRWASGDLVTNSDEDNQDD